MATSYEEYSKSLNGGSGVSVSNDNNNNSVSGPSVDDSTSDVSRTTLLQLWDDKLNSLKDEVDTLKTIGLAYPLKVNLNQDNIVERWEDRTHLSEQRDEVFDYEGGKPTPNETRNIETDVTRGEAKYDRSAHSNKYVETTNPSDSKGKVNYVYAYLTYSQNHVGNLGKDEIDDAAAAGFNAGQVLGYKGNFDGNFNIFKNKTGLNRRLVDETIRELALRNNVLGTIDEQIEAKQQELYEVLEPGITRLPILFRHKISLEDLLEQNMLLPKDGQFTPNRATEFGGTYAGFNTGSSDIDQVFNDTYLQSNTNINNRGASDRFPFGKISNIGVRDIQEPQMTKQSDGTYKPEPGSDVFSFRQHDKRYMTHAMKFRGFYSNIAGNVRVGNPIQDDAGTFENAADSGGKLLPAVKHVKDDTDQFAQSEANADSQYFPFMFETVNRSLNVVDGSKKQGVFEQFAFFQATLAQLQETYTPDWQSTHFSGRSEEIHTYSKTQRAFDLRFIIFANSMRELQNVYERVNWLSQQVYPLYNRRPDKMDNGPIIRVTIGDIIKGVAGFVRSLNFNWDHLGANKWEMTQGLRMPMSCEVSMGFQVLHDAMPDRDTDFYSGLNNRMLVGGRTDLSTFTPDAGANPEAFNSETNLIPTLQSKNRIGEPGENYVTLLGRKAIRAQQVSGGYLPGESISAEDLQSLLANYQEQTGESEEASYGEGRAQ